MQDLIRAGEDSTDVNAVRIGSAEWVRDRLTALPRGEGWCEHAAFRELVGWLYTVAHSRAGAVGVPSQARADVVQDAMRWILRALQKSRARMAEADNPAAMLERVAIRGVTDGRHRARMTGMGGVAANGRNWHERYPRQLGGQAAVLVFDSLPTPEYEPSPAVEHAADRVAAWVHDHLGIRLSIDAVNATVYVLDRLVAGVSRGALLRGGKSSLTTDPAMHHLGFAPPAASAFGVWLLGRQDPAHNAPSVLDAVLSSDEPPLPVAERWRRHATTFGFAQEHSRAEVPQFALPSSASCDGHASRSVRHSGVARRERQLVTSAGGNYP
jgi:DNA-directed RNA polymerase specialized sigma24 family protein